MKLRDVLSALDDYEKDLTERESDTPNADVITLADSLIHWRRCAAIYIREHREALERFELERAARELACAPDHAGVCWVEGRAAPELDQPYIRTASCDVTLVIVGRDWRPE